MTPKQEAALRQAREALEKCDSALAEELAAWDIDPPLHHVLEASNACGPAIAAIDEALAETKEKYQYGTPLLDAMTGKTAQPAQPDCPECGNNRQVWDNQITGKKTCHRAGCHLEIEQPANVAAVNTSPPASKPLTDEEIAEIMVQIWSNNNIPVRERSHRLARAIESAHGIKGDA